MAKKQKEWIDGRGQTVPASYVSKYDKARDKAVRHVVDVVSVDVDAVIAEQE